MRRRLLLLLLVAALAFAASGCGGGAPSALKDCRHSTTKGSDEDVIHVLPRTYDCLVGAYRDGCSAARARIGVFGVDTGSDFAVRLYRRHGRCAGDVTSVFFFMGTRRKPQKASCGQAYLFRGKLSLFGCGKVGELDFSRGRDCTHLLEQIRREAYRRRGLKAPPLKEPARPFPLAC